jgi:uncharacterized protein with PIN domain
MGHDAALAPATPLTALYQRAYQESRVVVTRNRRVKTSCLFRVVQLNGRILEEQLRQMLQEVPALRQMDQAFKRCDQCNVAVEPIEKAMVQDKVPPYVFQTQERFHTCPVCHRVYWAATHWQRTSERLNRLQQDALHN